MLSPEQLTEFLEPIVGSCGIDLDDLRVVKAGNRRILEVVVDGDQGIDLDKVAEVSRAISEGLDEHPEMGEQAYTLEVSTRGVGTPLSKPVHWRRNVGRLVTVTGDSVNASGRIVEFEEPIVTINVKGQMRKFDISTFSSALIEVEFNRKDTEA